MSAIDLAIRVLRNFEGLRLEAYQDAVGIWTIGYGLAHAYPGQKITKEEAEKLLREHVERLDKELDDLVTIPISEVQRAALLSFTYNVGAGAFGRSTLLKRLNAGDFPAAVEQFDRWVYADGRKLRGLVSRRKAEAELFVGGDT